MSMRWDIDLSGLHAATERLDAAMPAALAEGMEHIHETASPLVPVETGRLVGSGTVTVDGDQAALHYDGPYARYQHEWLDLRHEHGQAKFLEQPVATEGEKAVQIVGHRLRDAL